jgi:hypothetical protein
MASAAVDNHAGWEPVTLDNAANQHITFANETSKM